MDHTLEKILARVQKPGRYVGGEYNAIKKEKNDVDCRFAFCFPDTYEIGMSNLGMRILYGVINENRSRGNCSFPRNSIMVQTPGEKDENLVWLADYVQTNDPNADRYYQVRTHIRHPKATLSDEKIQAGEIDQDYLYWAGDATIYNNQMQMLWGAVDNTDPNNLMRRFGTCLATYSLEGKPGDATYMKLISRNDNFNDHTLGYGDTMWEDEDGHIYLYTTSNYKVAVARTATRDLGSQWEYYVADPQGHFSWTTQYPSTQDAENSTIIPLESACSMPWVFKKGDTTG